MKRLAVLFLSLCHAVLGAYFDVNLLTNGGAEADGIGYVQTGWTWNPITDGEPSIQAYNTSGGWPTSSSPGPSDRGTNFFYGGESPFSFMRQTNHVPDAYTNYLDEGLLNYIFSGWFGGYDTDPDFVFATAQFLDVNSTLLTNRTIGPVTVIQRNNETGLFYRSAEGDVPTGTRKILVTVQFTRFQGTVNDAYADNISVEFTPKTRITYFSKTNDIFYFTIDNLFTPSTNAIDSISYIKSNGWSFVTDFVATNTTMSVTATNSLLPSNLFFRISGEL